MKQAFHIMDAPMPKGKRSVGEMASGLSIALSNTMFSANERIRI
jgi:hypothetical protein